MHFELAFPMTPLPVIADPTSLLIDRSFNSSIESYLNKYKSQENVYPCFNCLKGHFITPEMRNRMVDWMIEVLTKCHCSGTTFFLAVNLMERFLKFGPQGYQGEKIHILGLVSMYIASKFEDIQAIDLTLLEKGIAHGKYSAKELKKVEIDILVALKFDLKITMGCDFLGFLCAILQPPAIITRTAEIILILNKLEYNTYYLPCEEAVAALYISSQSLNQPALAETIFKLSDFSEEDLEMTIISMRNYIYGFKLRPHKLKAVTRELGFAFAGIEENCFFQFKDIGLAESQVKLMSGF